MALYRRKPPEIEAIQWSGDEADLPAAQAFLADDFVGTTGTSPNLTIIMRSAHNPEATIPVPPGHMLLHDEHDHHHASDPNSFLEVFELSPSQ